MQTHLLRFQILKSGINTNGLTSQIVKKCDVFNEYFANQCTLNANDSALPNSILKTNDSLSHIYASKNQIVSIMKNQESKQAHGCDGISVSC